MKHITSVQKIINRGLLFFFLVFTVGCGTSATATSMPTSTSNPPTFTATPRPTSTITPTITPSATPSPVPIPPMPTFEVLDEYAHPMVEITDQQGNKTIVQVRSIDTGDAILNQKGFISNSFPLEVADDVYVLVEWREFRRAYLSGEEYTVTMANEQDVKGQLDFAIVDDNGSRYDLPSISTMVLVGLDKRQLPFIGSPRNPKGQKWQIHVLEPTDLTLEVIKADFLFEFSIDTLDSQGNVVSTNLDYANTEFFALGPDDIDRKLSSYDEVSLNKNDQITVTTNGAETSGTLFLIPDSTPGVKFLTNKGRTPNWYLQAYLLESKLTVLLRKPVCTLTKIE